MHAQHPKKSYAALNFFIAFILLGLPPLLGLIWLIWRPPTLPATPWPTALLIVETTSITKAEASPLPARPAAPPTPTPLTLHPGLRVFVADTGGAGLNLRAAPSLQAESLLIAQEGTTFQLLQGPLKVDGFQWWRLQKTDDPQITGWAVEQYLRPAP